MLSAAIVWAHLSGGVPGLSGIVLYEFLAIYNFLNSPKDNIVYTCVYIHLVSVNDNFPLSVGQIDAVYAFLLQFLNFLKLHKFIIFIFLQPTRK